MMNAGEVVTHPRQFPQTIKNKPMKKKQEKTYCRTFKSIQQFNLWLTMAGKNETPLYYYTNKHTNLLNVFFKP